MIFLSRRKAEFSLMKKNYETLDGLRGVAALVVVLFHFSDPQIAPNGYLAVDLFFVISGIVLYRAYNEELLAGLTAGPFILMRYTRLAPSYLLALLLGAAIFSQSLLRGHVITGWNWQEIGMAALFGALFVPVRGHGELYPLNLPSWSLGMELLVNFVYALVARRLAIIPSLAIMAIAGAFIVANAFAGHDLNAGAYWTDWSMGIPRVFYGFTAGLLIEKCASGRIVVSWISSLLILVLVAVLLCVPVSRQWVPAFDAVAALIFMPLTGWLAISVQPGRLKPVFTWFGLISYPLYVLHHPLWTIYSALIFGPHNSNTATRMLAGNTQVVIFILLLMIISTAIEYFFDLPIRKKLRSALLRYTKVR